MASRKEAKSQQQSFFLCAVFTGAKDAAKFAKAAAKVPSKMHVSSSLGHHVHATAAPAAFAVAFAPFFCCFPGALLLLLLLLLLLCCFFASLLRLVLLLLLLCCCFCCIAAAFAALLLRSCHCFSFLVPSPLCCCF